MLSEILLEKYKRNYRQEYDRFHANPAQRKRNAARKRARRKLERSGRVRPFDGKDVDHKNKNANDNSDGNLRVRSKSANRSDNRQYERKKTKNESLSFIDFLIECELGEAYGLIDIEEENNVRE